MVDSTLRLFRQKIVNVCKQKTTENLFECLSKVIRKKVTLGTWLMLTKADRKLNQKLIYYAWPKSTITKEFGGIT